MININGRQVGIICTKNSTSKKLLYIKSNKVDFIRESYFSIIKNGFIDPSSDGANNFMNPKISVMAIVPGRT